MSYFFYITIIIVFFVIFYLHSILSKLKIGTTEREEIEKVRKERESFIISTYNGKKPLNLLEGIVGQENAIRALKRALFDSNPKHVILYGPVEAEKKIVTKLIFQSAKLENKNFFRVNSKFVEVDCTTLGPNLGIDKNPLMGSVDYLIHKNIDTGESIKIPQPILGAYTKANKGILFLSQIENLNFDQYRSLLKVLREGKVFIQSPYYNTTSEYIPDHIHRVFQKGLDADFRLVASTSVSPGDIPVELRSQCIEIYFRPLNKEEIDDSIRNICIKGGLRLERNIINEIKNYSANVNEAINMLEVAAKLERTGEGNKLTPKDVHKIIEVGNYELKPEGRSNRTSLLASVHGVAVTNNYISNIIRIEASAIKLPIRGRGRIIVTGTINKKIRGTSDQNRLARLTQSMDNILASIEKILNIDLKDYDIHLNFSGGTPLDESSIGIAVATAIYSAINNIAFNQELVMLGTISDLGYIGGVEEISSKIQTAVQAGYNQIFIPKDNYKNEFGELGILVVPIEDIGEVFKLGIVGIKISRDEINSDERVGLASVLGKKNKK